MVKLVDHSDLRAHIKKHSEKTAAEIAGVSALRSAPSTTSGSPATTLEDRIRKDFRVFLVLLWRHLLGVDPAPAMLDMAWYLQHGPERCVIMAFRGFSKSWITGAYALWLLYCDPDEKVLVVSGALDRAVATTNWCLMLILSWPVLKHLRPKAAQRQSSKAFDVGPALPEQSPSFHAMGIGSQMAGFRATIIIPDDVETSTNSITSTMRQKIRDAVKEFDSVLKPGGRIKYLGTPHDEESLYNEMPKRGYEVRKWPGRYPNADQVKRYGKTLAPYVVQQLGKLGPAAVGTSTMPSRFPDEDLAKRELSLGRSEFALQFMLDTTLADRDKYPLKLKDLMVMTLDAKRGPEVVTWSADPERRLVELQPMGFEGDYYYRPVVAPDVRMSPYNRIVAAIDNSGRGTDETSMVVLGEINGVLFLLALYASRGGFDPETLLALSRMCVRYRVNVVRVESNFGDGMFTALLQPVLTRAWESENRKLKAQGIEEAGTSIEEVKVSNLMQKEKRILSIMEPVVQSHRLVVAQAVVEEDLESISRIEGEDGRHRYSLFHQLTHVTRERECLEHEDRLDALSLGVGAFADVMGVDPHAQAVRRLGELEDEELERLFGGDQEEDEEGILKGKHKVGQRPKAAGVQAR